jgi:hypothetical protein
MAEAEQELSAATAALPARGALENLVEWFGPFTIRARRRHVVRER